MKKVLVLGCGPAGLMAAQACEEAGFYPVIVSKKRKSEMYGAQYLHAPIPGIDAGSPFEVTYVLNGTPQQYREKVYGRGYRGTVSPEDLEQNHTGWDLRRTYDLLWKRFSDKIINTNFTSPQETAAFLNTIGVQDSFSHYLSTIPAPLLCTDMSHSFQGQEVYAVGDAPERGIFSPIKVEENSVVCSGDPEVSWYRASNILGYSTVEWPGHRAIPPLEGVTKIIKPLVTNCNCLPFVHRLGRYGKWQKGVLSHTAYFETFHGLILAEEVKDEEVSTEESESV